MLFYPKHANQPLTIGLSAKEFQCQCTNMSCRATLVHPDLLEAYEKFRVALNVALIITSGYRCPLHNFSGKVGGSPLSRHTSGQAIDITWDSILKSGKSKKAVVNLAIKCGFTFVLQYQSFVHLDVRDEVV